MFREKKFGTIETARKIGIEMHRLYCWERHGVVRPIMQEFGTRKFRRYSQEDTERAMFIKFLVDEEGYTLRAAVRKLEERNINGGRDVSFENKNKSV